MKSLEITTTLPSHIHPLPGRVLLEIEPKPSTAGLLHLPNSARTQQHTDTALFARVLAVGYGPYYDDKKVHSGVNESDVRPGDRVVFKALMQDLNCKVILTGVSRLEAVVDA